MTLLPRARADMPLLIGSNGPRMLRITTAVDLWNSWYTGFDNDPDGIPHCWRPSTRPAARSAATPPRSIARPPSWSSWSGGAVAPQAVANVPMSHRSPARRRTSPSRWRFEDAGITHVQVVLDPIDAVAVTQMGEVLTRLR